MASLLKNYRKAESADWNDKNRIALGAVVEECRGVFTKSIGQLRECQQKLESMYSAVESYEKVSLSAPTASGNVDWNSTMNTDSELAQLREMEKNGELEVSAVELLSGARYVSGNRLTQEPITITLPANTNRYSLEDFAHQVLGQEDGLNSLTVYDFLRNYENRANSGRDPASADTQQEYRIGLIEMIADDMLTEEPSMNPAQARADAEACVQMLSALHNPDQIVGGFGIGVTGAGARNVNSAIGSLWRHGRAQSLYRQVLEASSGMSESQMRQTYLNVRLRIEDRNA